MTAAWCASILVAALATASLSTPVSADPTVARSDGLATRKIAPAIAMPALLPVRATLAQTHTPERVIVDDAGPPGARFDALLADRTTGESHPLDPRLLDLLRQLAAKYSTDGPPRIELVSGFRSAKLNEMLRKKGHHVASHSQHTLGHAVDFRIVPARQSNASEASGAGDSRDSPKAGVDPREVEQAIRKMGWPGGVGVYTGDDDWFVHADVGPERGWKG